VFSFSDVNGPHLKIPVDPSWFSKQGWGRGYSPKTPQISKTPKTSKHPETSKIPKTTKSSKSAHVPPEAKTAKKLEVSGWPWAKTTAEMFTAPRCQKLANL
jgi:hypothetical protein